jgi:hypothetical protein
LSHKFDVNSIKIPLKVNAITAEFFRRKLAEIISTFWENSVKITPTFPEKFDRNNIGFLEEIKSTFCEKIIDFLPKF